MMTFNTSIRILTILVFLIFSGSVFSQGLSQSSGQEDMIEPKKQNSSLISENYYNCFKELHCLKNNREIREKGLDIQFDRKRHFKEYQLSGETRNEKLDAVYDDQGRLIEARLVRVNFALPRFITEQLVTGQYADWRMIGNEMVVENFDAKTTRYKVILQKEDQGTVLYFDRHGNQMNHFAGL